MGLFALSLSISLISFVISLLRPKPACLAASLHALGMLKSSPGSLGVFCLSSATVGTVFCVSAASATRVGEVVVVAEALALPVRLD